MRIYYLIFALILISQADGQVGSDLFEEGIITVKISSGYLEKTSDLFSLSDNSLFLVSIQNDLQWNITNVSVPTAAQFVGTDDSQNRSIYGALPIHLPMGIDQGQQDLLTFTTLGSGSQAKGLQYVIGIDFLLTDGREFQLQIRNQDLYGSVTESCQDTNGYCFYWDLTNVTTSYQFNGTVPLQNTPETSKCLTDDICISWWKLQKEGEVATAMKVRLYSNTISPEILNQDSFYTIWNNQGTHALTAAVNSTNSSDPIEVYQYTNLGDSSQEWRFHFIAEEGGYAIVNEKLLLLLTATSDGTLEIQKYNNDDPSAQLWFPRRLTDGKYQIQNLEYKTFLSSENQVDNNDLWTLKETVDSSTLAERFVLNFIEIDVLQDQLTVKNDYYHMIAPETAPQMGVTAISSPVSVQLQAQDTTNKQQFWLIKNVTQPNTNTTTTGFIIMNHGLNLVLAIDANNTLIASPLISTTDAASLSQLWDVQLRDGSIYSSSSYQIRNLKYTDYYLTTDAIINSNGSNLFVTTAPESGFLLTRSDVKGYTPFTNNVPYHISTFKTTTQYVMDTFSNNLIYGWSVTGQLKQKWKLYNATKTSDGTSRPNAFYVQSMYNLSTTGLTYLTYTTSSAVPKSALGSVAIQDQQSWTVLADPNYYGLVYTIRPYLYAASYLTAPATKTNNAGFTLEISSTRPDDQRFRILISDETFFK